MPVRVSPLSVASVLTTGLWILIMSRSPSLQGLSGTVHVRAVVLALSEVRLRVVVPVTSMKSMAKSASDAVGLRVMVTAPSSHFRLEMVVVVPSSEKAFGFRTPLELSAPTALPTSTGSNNASCSVRGGAVTWTDLVCRFWFLSSSVNSVLHIEPPHLASERNV